MPSERAQRALFDIRDNALLARAFVEGLTEESLQADLLRFYAVTRCLEIISEASRRLPTAVRDSHPELPWRDIMGVGNVYRHDYDNVDEAFVWRTVHRYLPPLLAVVEAEIASLPSRP